MTKTNPPVQEDVLPVMPKLADPDSLFDAGREEDLIGCVLVDGAKAFKDADTTPDVFYIHRNRWAWEAIGALVAEGKQVNHVSVGDELERAGHLDNPDERARLLSLFAGTSSGVFAASYATRLKDLAARRHGYTATMAEANKKATTAKKFLDFSQHLTESTRPARKTLWNISELLSTDFPDPTGPLPGIIPVGLTILGGRPKRGKSWLMLQFAYALAVGGKFLDHDLAINKVLYFALEDSPRRLKDRLAKFDPDPSAMIEFERELKPLHLGGLEQIRKAAEDHYLIVIDTLARCMPGRDFSKDGGLFADVLGQLQSIALENNIAIVVILHTRKPAGMEHDPVDDILGSTQGLTAAPDCVLALYKEKGKTGARLEGRGRDFDDIDLTIEFDSITCAWQLVGETGEVVETEKETAILEALHDLGKARIGAIVKATGMDQGNTSRRCANLWVKGLIRKELINGVNHYYLPIQDT